MHHRFVPHAEKIGELRPGRVGKEVIEAEQMLFSASFEFAWNFGGPLTEAALRKVDRSGALKEILRCCEISGRNLVVDTRSHMLMSGQYPAIPGWHGDFYPRTQDAEGQPDLRASGEHRMVFCTAHLSTGVGGPVSATRFLSCPIEVEVDPARVWGSVHEAVDSRQPPTVRFDDGDLVLFSQPTLHRAEAARCRGWRWFVRVGASEEPPQNRIRRQVQVYANFGGW